MRFCSMFLRFLDMLCNIVLTLLSASRKVTSMPKTVISINEASNRYGITGTKLRTLISRGRLVAYRIDGKVHLEDGAVEALVSRKCPVCPERFSPKNNRQVYCSQRCQQKAFRDAR